VGGIIAAAKTAASAREASMAVIQMEKFFVPCMIRGKCGESPEPHSSV